jgi:hypothetical protein
VKKEHFQAAYRPRRPVPAPQHRRPRPAEPGRSTFTRCRWFTGVNGSGQLTVKGRPPGCQRDRTAREIETVGGRDVTTAGSPRHQYALRLSWFRRGAPAGGTNDACVRQRCDVLVVRTDRGANTLARVVMQAVVSVDRQRPMPNGLPAYPRLSHCHNQLRKPPAKMSPGGFHRSTVDCVWSSSCIASTSWTFFACLSRRAQTHCAHHKNRRRTRAPSTLRNSPGQAWSARRQPQRRRRRLGGDRRIDVGAGIAAVLAPIRPVVVIARTTQEAIVVNLPSLRAD